MHHYRRWVSNKANEENKKKAERTEDDIFITIYINCLLRRNALNNFTEDASQDLESILLESYNFRRRDDTISQRSRRLGDEALSLIV